MSRLALAALVCALVGLTATAFEFTRPGNLPVALAAVAIGAGPLAVVLGAVALWGARGGSRVAAGVGLAIGAVLAAFLAWYVFYAVPRMA